MPLTGFTSNEGSVVAVEPPPLGEEVVRRPRPLPPPHAWVLQGAAHDPTRFERKVFGRLCGGAAADEAGTASCQSCDRERLAQSSPAADAPSSPW